MSALQNKRRPASGESSLEGELQLRQAQKRRNADSRPGSADEAHSDTDDPDRSADLQLAKKLVRYALSCEYSRTPIRRDGIKERVLGAQARSFKKIFALAQEQLKTAWGMEMRELPVREKTPLQERRQAMKSDSQPKTGTGAYALFSTLPVPLHHASILSPSKTPSADKEAIYVAFYTTTVSLIWLNGGELSDQKLKRHLMRFNADQNVSDEKTELTLKRMERHGYVTKKVERAPLGQDGDETVTWHVGPRAKEEIGADGITGMVREVYDEWNATLEQNLRSSLGVKDKSAAEANNGLDRVDESGASPGIEGSGARSRRGEHGE